MAAYIALVRKEKGTNYGVDFPDFPGCVSGGASLDEAWRNAREALELHIEGMIEDGEVIPAPSALDDIMKDKHNRDGVVALVPGPEPRARAVRINVTIDENLLRQIDDVVGERGRSAFIARVARDNLPMGAPKRGTASKRKRA